MFERDPNRRIERLCDGCGGIDSAPHHDLTDGVVYLSRHMDCCAETGCDDCKALLAAAGDKRDDALTEFITSGGADSLNYAAGE